MRRGMDILLRLLRREVNLAASDDDWAAILALAEEENILPWTAARLRAQSSGRGPLAGQLDAIRQKAQYSAFLWRATLRSVLAGFNRRSIPVISLKGPWLTERLCGDAALKLYSDLDLLVRPEDIGCAEGLLAEMGFRANVRRDDYQRPWTREGLIVELHHNVENPLAFAFDIEGTWERAVPARFDEIPARLMDPADELHFLCFHGVRHRFERLSHVLDLALAFQHFGWPPRGNRRIVPADRVTALGAMMAFRLTACVELAKVLNDMPYRAALEDVANRLWEERMERRAPRLDWRAQHKLLLDLEPPGRTRFATRIRHLRILCTRLIDADFRFAAALHADRVWQVWLLRPVRLFFKYTGHAPSESSRHASATALSPVTPAERL